MITLRFDPPITKKEARAQGITTPVTRTALLTDAEMLASQKIIDDFRVANIPAAVVIEKTTRAGDHGSVWRGRPPKPARTAHQFRRLSYATTTRF